MGSRMLFAIVVFLILATCACRPLHKVSSLTEKYERWMLRHKRTYTDDGEKEKRFKIFKNNVNFIEHFNKYDNTTFKLKINKFADLSHEELLENFTGLKMPSRAINPLDGNRPFRYENVFDVPNTIDWRKEGAVGPVKNQQRCASCWAFSTTGAVEGITKIKTGKLVSLSEQQLVDCATNGNHGCYGGFMDNAFWYIIQNQGITTEANYPYLVTQWYCQPRRSRSIAAQITGFEDVPANNEEALLKAVSKQPVSAAIDATNLWFYSSGVIAYNCGTNINHAILIVGYGTTDDGLDYWLVKNSWGRNWGEQGYFRILRNSGSPEGICGIANRPSYPTMD